MSLLVLAPFTQGPIRGNRVSVDRTVSTLRKAGLEVCLREGGPRDSLDALVADTQSSTWRLIHAFHAFHAGVQAYNLARVLELPYLITITGSDLFEEQYSANPLTAASVTAADRIICFDRLIGCQVAKTFAVPTERIVTIPQGVQWYADAGDAYRSQDGRAVLFLPAALRPVKGVLEMIEALAPLYAQCPFELLVAGGALDAVYAERVRQLARCYPFVTLLGEVPHEQMGYYYRGADLLLNGSWFEGGLANSVLEGLAMGCTVVARDVIGNRAAVSVGENGYLFTHDDELLEIVMRLLSDRQALTAGRGRIAECARQRYSPQQEGELLLACYRSILNLSQDLLF